MAETLAEKDKKIEALFAEIKRRDTDNAKLRELLADEGKKVDVLRDEVKRVHDKSYTLERNLERLVKVVGKLAEHDVRSGEKFAFEHAISFLRGFIRGRELK